ncbi:MAG: DUF2723 domain-containing protein [Chloroflexota bacterium]|nr:DUF2723 domain-containing protein [Chloroflexota bacterium]MDE2898233.1 DUF2723 domain-containing protein [Chloroflexota bacterium]
MPRIPDRFAGAAIGLSAAAGVLAAYLLTLAPGVVWSGAGVDSGDLAAAVAVGGVPHPTGYPTVMLLGLAVRAIPLGDLALRLNVLTALAAAGSLLPLGLLAARLRPRSGTAMPAPEVASAAAVLTLYGLAPLVWSSAIVTEVYAFASLFLWSSLYAAERALAASQAGKDEWRWVATAGVLLGLGTGAHMTVTLGAPALAAVLLAGGRRQRTKWRLAAPAAAGVVAGCAVYIYLPIAAALDPPINWGVPSTPDRFWSVVSGEIYHSRLGGTDVGATAAKAAWLLGEPVRQLTWVSLPLLAAGAVSLIRVHRRAALATGWIAISALAFGTIYNSRDDEVLILPALTVAAVWSVVGLDEVARLAAPGGARVHRLVAAVVPTLLIASVVIRGTDVAPEISLRDATHAAAFAHAVLVQAESGSVLLTEDDRATFPLWYARYTPGGRTDVTVLDLRLWQFAWYRQLLGRHAGIPTETSPATLLAAGKWPAGRPLWAVDIDVGAARSADVLANLRPMSPP